VSYKEEDTCVPYAEESCMSGDTIVNILGH